MINENQLLKQKELREKNLGRIEVLDQVKELLLLGDTDFATKEMVSRYYEIKLKTLESCIEDNQKEIENNGMRLYKRREILNLLKGGIENNEIKIPNRGLILFSKRAILNVGMLLRDSDVAKEIRSRLLDIAHDSEVESGSIKTIITEIDEERSSLSVYMTSIYPSAPYNASKVHITIIVGPITTTVL